MSRRSRDLHEAEELSRPGHRIWNPGRQTPYFSLIVTSVSVQKSPGNPREKIKNAKIIREEAETYPPVSGFNVCFSPGLFLVRYHELSLGLNWYERLGL